MIGDCVINLPISPVPSHQSPVTSHQSPVPSHQSLVPSPQSPILVTIP
ncbi:hypothetical protein H6F47_05615 [Sphaerospermopsis sp. FACHB-1094]|nr:hypothetical protein [Sphaerospermopsis sp. FACHB-1094]MBD2131939.1 hypothetical protein [Sphaerospermopsis sp. FACHB-1094]